MGVSRYYKEQKSQHGTKTAIKKTLQYGLRKIAGTDQYEVQLAKQQEELNTLHYFLNNYADITKVKPATGTLRDLQLCDATFLAIVDKILQKNNLQYWMGWGTLLGAVRHKGFIPWDDDLDICMLREDFEKALNLLPSECEQVGLKFHERDAMGWLGIGYTHGGLWVDIFPIDSVQYNRNCADEATLKEQLREYNKYFAVSSADHRSKNEIMNSKEVIIKGLTNGETADIYFESMELNTRTVFYLPSELFPLRRLDFEGYSLSAPNNPDAVLKQDYGDYMSFPREGVCHHLNPDNLDGDALKRIKSELEEIYNHMK